MAFSTTRSTHYVGAGYVVVPSSFLSIPANPEVSQQDHNYGDEFADDLPQGRPPNPRYLTWLLTTIIPRAILPKV